MPADLHKRFNKGIVIISLRTRSQDKTMRSATTLSDRIERHWESLRLELFHSRELGLYLRQEPQMQTPQSDFTLDDALELYLSLKGAGRRKTFFQVAHRAVTYLKETTVTAEITGLTSSDASAFKEHLFSKGLTSSSVRRIFSCIKSILNLAIKEQGLNSSNPFASTFIPDDLATKSSERQIPLIGASLWAAQRVVDTNHEFAFPKYINGSELNSNSASATINKWLKPRVPEGCVVHSFRHSFRDRLRNIECPSDIADALGGWTISNIGQKYGIGYDLKVKQKWLKKIEVRGSSFGDQLLSCLKIRYLNLGSWKLERVKGGSTP